MSSKHHDDRPVSSLAIKLNNFALWGSSGCVLPYLSIYFSYYARASSSDVGVVMFLSSVLGMLFNLGLCSLSDRYRAHRFVYNCMLLCSLLVHILLFIPMFAQSGGGPQDNQEEEALVPPGPALNGTTDELVLKEDNSLLDANQKRTLGMDNGLWFYMIAFCVGAGSALIDNLLIFSESFSANIATRCGKSYGSVKFWATSGLCASALTLFFVNYTFRENLFGAQFPYLAAEFCLFTVLTTANILLVLSWRDKRPFDLSSSCAQTDAVEAGEPKRAQLFHHQTKDQQVVRLKGVTQWLRFDSQDDETNRNVRRCSLSPLGVTGFVVKQYELNSKADQFGGLKFKFVTKLEASPSGDPSAIKLGDCKDKLVVEGKLELRCESDGREGGWQAVSLETHLKTVKLIAERDKDMLRFMLLYVVIGFIVAQNWVYLFPYLKELDADRFHRLASFVMISGYLSETLFYYASSRLVSRVSHAKGLSVILFIFALRNALYLCMERFPQLFPFEAILLIELLQAPTMGWFNCIFSDAPLQFASNHQARSGGRPAEGNSAEGGGGGSGQSVDVKLTLLGVSSCCFDGIGVAFGSIVGGRLIDLYGFNFLWLFIICLSLSVCCLNLLADSCPLGGETKLEQEINEKDEGPAQGEVS